MSCKFENNVGFVLKTITKIVYAVKFELQVVLDTWLWKCSSKNGNKLLSLGFESVHLNVPFGLSDDHLNHTKTYVQRSVATLA